MYWNPVNIVWNQQKSNDNWIFWTYDYHVTPSLELVVPMYNKEYTEEKNFEFEIYSVLYKDKVIDQWVYKCTDESIKSYLVIKAKE